MLCVSINKYTIKIKIVIIAYESNWIPDKLVLEIDFMNREYSETDVEFVVEHGVFSTELIKNYRKNGIF